MLSTLNGPKDWIPLYVRTYNLLPIYFTKRNNSSETNMMLPVILQNTVENVFNLTPKYLNMFSSIEQMRCRTIHDKAGVVGRGSSPVRGQFRSPHYFVYFGRRL